MFARWLALSVLFHVSTVTSVNVFDSFELLGSNVVPSVTTSPNAIGYAYYWYDPVTKMLDLNVVVSRLDSTITSIAMYCGANSTTNGYKCLRFPTTTGLEHRVAEGLSGPVAADFEAGHAYVSISTANNASGALRGNIPILNNVTQTMPNMLTTMAPTLLGGEPDIGHSFFWFDAASSSMEYRIYYTIVGNSATIIWMQGTGGANPIGEQAKQLNNVFANPSLGTVTDLNNFRNAGDETVATSIAEFNFQVAISTSQSLTTLLGQVEPYGVAVIPSGTFTQLGASISPNRRGSPAVKVTVAVSFPATTAGNEIWVTLPDGFTANTPGATGVEWVIGVDAPTEVYASNRMVHLRYGTSSPSFTNRADVRFTLTNIQVPMTCTDLPYTVELKQCDIVPLHSSPVMIRSCAATANFTVTKTTGTGVPHNCGPCDACEFMYRGHDGEAVYTCFHDGKKYQRNVAADYDTPCHNTNPALAPCTGNPRNLAHGCAVN